MSSKVWETIEGHGWKGNGIVWATGKLGTVRYAWVRLCVSFCLYMTMKGEEKLGSFRMM